MNEETCKHEWPEVPEGATAQSDRPCIKCGYHIKITLPHTLDSTT